MSVVHARASALQSIELVRSADKSRPGRLRPEIESVFLIAAFLLLSWGSVMPITPGD
jgi:hypothetical protein